MNCRSFQRIGAQGLGSIIAVLLLVVLTSAAEVGELSKLNWANGDQLSGELVSADGTHLQWQAPVFTAPFVLDMKQLHSVRFPLEGDLQKTDEPFRIFTHSGDVLNGRIMRIDGDAFIIDCKRHGRITLKRSRIRSLRRLNDPALIFEGPSGLTEWSTISRSRNVNDWRSSPQGGLQTAIVGAELYRDLKLPAVAEVEITLTWKQKPGFLVTFVEPNARRVPKHTVKLETWDDELVMQALASTGDFAQVETLSKEEKSIQLRLLWDQSSNELTAYSRAGEMLAKLNAEPHNQNLTCLYIKNKGSDLKVSNIRVRSWNGTALSALAEGRAHVHRLDGSFVYGRIEKYDPQQSPEVLVTSPQGSHRIPLDQVSGADLGGAESEQTAEKVVQVSYTDGTVLGGELRSIEAGRIRIKTEYAEAPIETDLPGAYILTFKPDATSYKQKSGDILEYRGARLHGNLAPVGKAGRLGWKPVGSKNASPLLSKDPARVVRKVSAATTPPPDKREMIYLRNGDIIPCRVVSIGQDLVDVDPAFASVTSIPRSQVKAITLASDASEAVLEFDHPSWMIRAGQEKFVKRSANKAVFMNTATLTHMDLLAGDSLQFDVEWTANEPVSVTVGLQAPHLRRSTAWRFKLYFTGEQVHVQGLRANQGFVYRHRLRERTANIQISLRSNRFHMRINGDTALNQPFEPGTHRGRGVAFAIKRERPVPGTMRENLITISNLRTGNMRFLSGTVDLQSDKKEQILTIPRHRRKNPPTHLMVAYNGDLLRGRLVSMGEEHVTFRSRLDDLQIPRDRVGMLVWLDKAGEEDAQAESPDAPLTQQLERPMQAVLLGGITFSFSADKMVGNEIVGQHPLLGDCRLPVNQVREVRIGSAAKATRRSVFSDWKLQNAPEPKFATAPGTGGSESGFGVDSPLVGTQAENFRGQLLNGQAFSLNQHADKIVVLDFWATWCGPCIRAMPDLMATIAEFPEDKVILVGVNQQENEKTIADFLKAREWDLTVVLDPDGDISQKFQVQAIPQTVVIGPGGKIERLHIGAHNGLGEELKKVLTELTGGGVEDAPPAGG